MEVTIVYLDILVYRCTTYHVNTMNTLNTICSSDKIAGAIIKMDGKPFDDETTFDRESMNVVLGADMSVSLIKGDKKEYVDIFLSKHYIKRLTENNVNIADLRSVVISDMVDDKVSFLSHYVNDISYYVNDVGNKIIPEPEANYCIMILIIFFVATILILVLALIYCRNVKIKKKINENMSKS
jgi:hypothetical protein